MRNETADDKSQLKSPARLEIAREREFVLAQLQGLGKPDTLGCLGILARLWIFLSSAKGRAVRLSWFEWAQLQEARRTIEVVFDRDDKAKLGELYLAAGWAEDNACRILLDSDRSVIPRGKNSVRAGLAVLHPELVDVLQYIETSSGLPQSLDCRRVPWPRQPYMGKEPYGIQVESAWDPKGKKEGAAGEGVAFALVDEGVDVLHPDFPKQASAVHVIECSENLSEFAHHGTKALGIVAAASNNGYKSNDDVNDGSDVTGIAYRLSYLGFSSVRQKNFVAYNEPRAILRAIHWLYKLDLRRGEKPSRLGKILLIERFMNDRSQDPVDTHPLIWCLIKLAVACRIVVVIPAGNGQETLGERSGSKDSGAIIVGAALPLHQDPRHKPTARGAKEESEGSDSAAAKDPKYQIEEFSNRGPGVDCYAWGRCIRTTAFNGGYSDFDGTSGAAAIVAGMAALVQSLAIKWYNKPLSPCCVREIFRRQANGIPLRSGEDGAVPTMKRIVKNLDSFHCSVCGAAPDRGPIG